ncbi:MAG: VTT domain-containing protein, partial [Dehalococcoidia bacterium]|nr:VTT domain-containing protein [Dehalococcoidia bacterium]
GGAQCRRFDIIVVSGPLANRELPVHIGPACSPVPPWKGAIATWPDLTGWCPAAVAILGLSWPSWGEGEGLLFSLFVAALLLAFLGEIAVPVPFIMEGVLLVVGYQVGSGHWEFLSVLIFAFIGRQIGAAVLYWLARLNRKLVMAWLNRHAGRLTKLMTKVESYINVWGGFGVLLARLIPGLIVPASISSGTLGLKYIGFALGVAASGLIWDGGFILLGSGLGFGISRLTQWATGPRAILGVIGGVVLLTAIGLLVYWWRKRPKKIAS